MNNRKKIIHAAIFLVIMILTCYAVFHGQNLPEIWKAIREISVVGLVGAIALALFFVSAEGIMIHYLLNAMGGKSGIFRCIQYSFLGFFYSGITPSATGGQPMQLYYMKRDGNNVSDSTAILMTVALMYKLVLVLMGIAIAVIWNPLLKAYLKSYYPLFFLGLFLNAALVVVIVGVMVFPEVLLKVANGFSGLLVKMRIWKASPKREAKVQGFIDQYRQAVGFIGGHKGKMVVILLLTFVQRISVFFLPYIIYWGFGLRGTDALTIIILQATIYIAVDMLPLPGSQGITELMYQVVFEAVFAGGLLVPSMLVSRGINFYFLLIVSGITALAVHYRKTC